jgi:hypothetical protein
LSSRPFGPALVVPAILAVSAVVAPGCNGGEKTTMTEATEVATVATSEPTPTGGETDGVPNCPALTDQAACTAAAGCVWDDSDCIVDCAAIEDRATCEMQDYCEWYNEQCSLLLA